jgi:hypothetical protein
MGYAGNNYLNYTSRWISDGEYDTVFKALRVNPVDPQVMVVAGFLNQDKSIQLKPTVLLQNGIETPFDPITDGSVTEVGTGGTILSKSSFSSSFSLIAEDGSVLPTTSSFFLVQLPLSQGGEAIQISYNGNVLKTINPTSQLLIDTIEGISPDQFVRHGTVKRRKLVNQARATEALLRGCSNIRDDRHHDNWEKIVCTDGIEERVLTLRDELSKLLLDSVKDSILRTIDYLAMQLLGNPTVSAGGHQLLIRILPKHSWEFLSISSVTQGEHGSVYINSDGTLTYKPNPGKPETDSFDVVVQDTYGTSVIKTVTIVTPCKDEKSIKKWANRFQ